MSFAPHFSREELIFSQTAARHGIDNTPTEAVEQNLERVSHWLEKLRDYVSRPIIVTSGYRCPELNKKIGGSKTSAHMEGLAADIVVSGVPALEVAQAAANYMAPYGYDQVIYEYDRDWETIP